MDLKIDWFGNMQIDEFLLIYHKLRIIYFEPASYLFLNVCVFWCAHIHLDVYLYLYWFNWIFRSHTDLCNFYIATCIEYCQNWPHPRLKCTATFAHQLQFRTLTLDRFDKSYRGLNREKSGRVTLFFDFTKIHLNRFKRVIYDIHANRQFLLNYYVKCFRLFSL